MPAARALSSPSRGALGPKIPGGDSKIFLMHIFQYQETFISDILRYDLKLYSVTDGITNGRTDRREV